MMTFVFEDVGDGSGDLVLYWDDLRVPITIEAE
jgi:hypothetical protein